jgi:hypothetical protein
VEKDAYSVYGLTIPGKHIGETLIPMLRAYAAGVEVTGLADYIADEFDTYSLAGDGIAYIADGTGAKREWFADVISIPDATLSTTTSYAEGFSDHYCWRVWPCDWYLAWLYVSTLAPTEAASIYAALKADANLTADYAALQAGTYDAQFALKTHLLNAHLAGLYGRWKLATLAGQSADAAAAYAVLQTYVTFWLTNFTLDTGYDTLAEIPGLTLRALNVARNWYYMQPEVAALIRAHGSYNATTMAAVLAAAAGTPAPISWAACTSRRVLAPSSSPAPFKLRVNSPSLTSFFAVSASIPPSAATICASISALG